MNMTQHLMMCQVCQDKNRFRRAVMDANRIANQLYMITCDLPDIKPDNHIIAGLQYDHMHISMMCGCCPHVEESELRRYERNINEALAKVIMCQDKTILRQALQLLRGYYPGKYHYVERTFLHIEKNKVI